MARSTKWTKELNAVLEEFVEKERDVSREAFEQVAKETDEMVKAKSPSGGAYASGWKVIPFGNKIKWSFIVANPTRYQLTHLLEKGHQAFNQFGGPYKRVSARRHIKPAETWGVQELIQRLRKEL